MAVETFSNLTFKLQTSCVAVHASLCLNRLESQKTFFLTTYKVTTVYMCTVMILSFRTDRSGQTVKTQIRLLVEEQSDLGLHCLLLYLHLFDKIH